MLKQKDIPEGVRVYNRRETEEIEFIKTKIENVFKRWCYQKITLPTFEYFDIHKRAFSKEIEDKVFKLVDRETGEILSLRADFTSQVARYYASLNKKDRPKRYYYEGRIFRYESSKNNKLWERFQIGIELLGVEQLEAEAEIVSISIQVLDELNIDKYQIVINNVKIFNSLKDILNLSNDENEKFLKYLVNREIFLIKDFIKTKTDDISLTDFILQFLKVQFNFNDLQNWKRKLTKYENLIQSLEELEKVYLILKEYNLNKNIKFDLAELREFKYYTGTVFEIYIEDFTKVIGFGGRYDNLLSNYCDEQIPATGFAFDLINIWEYLKGKNKIPLSSKKDYFIIDTTKDKKTAYQLAKTLMKNGFTVSRDIVNRDYKKSIEFAFKEGFKNVIVIIEENLNKKVLLYRKDRNYKKEFTEKEFIEGLRDKG